ncbi:cbb3-type cytochrome oxidase assembly protein [Ammoniphilus sp. YIM 78166]|nr:cbb3-type cytochrome oxidase assembly protein [Ammoniphilus sp. YIM 78166]
MTISTILLLTIMATFSLSAILLYFAAKKTGQFEDVEGIKYRMLEDES